MDIYSMGEEKCIDGVWGREFKGSFYTHSYDLYMCRLININNPSQWWFIYVCPDGVELLDWYTIGTPRQPIPYIPKHIRDLKNLKRGDIVWIKLYSAQNTYWVTTRFIGMRDDKYVTTPFFLSDGTWIPNLQSTQDKVFLKPPFEF